MIVRSIGGEGTLTQADLAARAVDVDWANFSLGHTVITADGGTFVKNADFPGIYDANHVSHITASTPEEIDRLMERVEVEFAGTNHRRFETDFRTPPGLLARLALEGYARDEALIMLLEGDLQGRPREFQIRPVESESDWAAMAKLHSIDWAEAQARTKQPPLEDIEKQMMGTKLLKQPPVQYFLAYDAGQPVAFFNSWHGPDGIGQVEDLFTHPDYRHRGIATALIHHCVADARKKGAGPVVIVSDPTDTPKNMYVAMGFRPVSVVGHYLRKLNEPPATDAA